MGEGIRNTLLCNIKVSARSRGKDCQNNFWYVNDKQIARIYFLTFYINWDKWLNAYQGNSTIDKDNTACKSGGGEGCRNLMKRWPIHPLVCEYFYSGTASHVPQDVWHDWGGGTVQFSQKNISISREAPLVRCPWLLRLFLSLSNITHLFYLLHTLNAVLGLSQASHLA